MGLSWLNGLIPFIREPFVKQYWEKAPMPINEKLVCFMIMMKNNLSPIWGRGLKFVAQLKGYRFAYSGIVILTANGHEMLHFIVIGKMTVSS